VKGDGERKQQIEVKIEKENKQVRSESDENDAHLKANRPAAKHCRRHENLERQRNRERERILSRVKRAATKAKDWAPSDVWL
jgi:hypothetical protein